MTATERLIKYVSVPTASNAGNAGCPSTEGQAEFARMLAREMLDMGITDARVDAHGYVYGTIPGNVQGAPVIGLIAHMDVVDDVPCEPMNPRRVMNYDGGVIELGGGYALDPAVFPRLKNYKGKTLIVTDGQTILGADDKAGIAEIMTLAEKLINDPSIKHGEVKIGFTPDEEIGRGANLFDVRGFGADFAYTVDGGELGGISFENFNAAGARVNIKGVNIHPGSAKHKMKNACLIATEFAQTLPSAETPAHTEGYEGFYHLNSISGDEENARLTYIIRDHDKQKFEARKEYFKALTALFNQRYGAGTLELDMKDSYYNMREIMVENAHVIRRAEDAFRALSITPRSEPIRGGTDGARLSFMGLPCPNLSTGAMNGHGRHECACEEDMETMVDVLMKIVEAN